MNKKLFTLLAGGMLALSTSAFAEGETGLNIDGVLSPVDKVGGTAPVFKTGDVYFVVADNDGTLDNTYSIALGMDLSEGVLASANALTKDLTLSSTNINKYKWVVTEIKAVNGTYAYTLKNVATKNYLAIKANSADGALEPNPANATANSETASIYFNYASDVAYDKGGTLLTLMSGVTNKELTVASTPATTTSSDGSKIYLFQQAGNMSLSAGELNNLMGDGFMFGFPKADPAPAANPFGSKLTAVEVKGNEDDEWNTSGTLVKQGTYFVSAAPSDAIVKREDRSLAFASKAKFDACTFVAVSPLANYDINGLTVEDGSGFKITTVKGEDLVAAANKAKGKTVFENALFTVSEPDPQNGAGEYNIAVTPYVASGEDVTEANADKVENALKVVSFTTMGASYVTTLTTANYATAAAAKKATDVVKVSTTNVLAAEDLLKSDAPAVFNIQFTSSKADLEKTTSSEYGKYLGIYDNSGYKLLAQGSSFLDLDAPQNQWYVSDVQNGIFTFTNRESATSINLQLRKTTTANVYDVVSTDNKVVNYAYVDNNGVYKIETETAKALNSGKLQIKLVAATITKDAGYLDLSKEELAQPIQIKFTVANKLLSKNMYVVADTDKKTVSLTEDENYATLWDIVKFAAKEDSISGKIKYAYMKDEETMDYKEVVDKAITTYALKINGLSKAWYLDFPNQTDGTYNVKQTDKIAQAQRYILKENKNGSIYLIKANVAESGVYGDNIKNTTVALSVNGSAELNTVGIYNAANAGVQMEFESVELLSTSLEAEPRHASFQSVNGGFLGMDENNDAIIAATQEEAKTLTFWLDTTDVKELSTSFYISQAMPEGLKAAEPRMFLFNPADSTSYYDEGTASTTKDYSYMLSDKATTKAVFKAATLINKDSINTVIKGEEVGLNKDNGLNRFKFQIVEANEDGDEYAIKSGNDYLTSINGKIGFGGVANALIVSLGEGDATANEAIAAEGVQVIGGKGAVTVQGAAGKVVTVANILGQTIANQVAASDNVTIAAPAGIVVVAVEGEATKVVVK